MKKTYLLSANLLLFFFFNCPITLADTAGHRISGRIIDKESAEIIDFADVLLFDKHSPNPIKHIYPDNQGNFLLSDLKEGEYTLLINLVGYDIFTKEDISFSGNFSSLDLGIIELVPLENSIAEIEVVARKRQIIYKLDKKVIEASANLMASGGTAVDILENTPSIRVDAEGNVTFRGSSGFMVYIDGKPGVFSGSQALEQIPSGLIENIEIITTPSARHDTEGDVGIINIITKENSHRGLNGIVNITGSTLLSRGVDFLVSNQNNKTRFYIGGMWNDHIRKSDFNQQKTTLVSDITTSSHSDGPRKSNNFNYSIKTGWNYDLPRSSFHVEFEGGYGGRTRNGDLDYTESRTYNNSIFAAGEYISRDDYDLHETYYQGTLDFSHQFNKDGHTLKGSFYLKYGGDALEYFQSDLFDREGKRQQGHRAWEDEHRWTVRANLDYVYPYRDAGSIEAGYQYFSYLEDGDYSMKYWDPDIQEFYWREDIYNTFYFQRGINSIYGILNESFFNFEFQGGLRGEHTHRVLRSSKDWANRTVNRFEVFPSVHLGYNFRKAHRLIVAFSRRTTRPELFFMEPYITYRDYYSAEIGNPDIRPEYINSFELSYNKNFGENSISGTGFYRKRKDKIERLRIPYEAGVTLDSMANVGHDYSAGIEISSQFRPVRWWGINLNGSLYRYKVKNEFKPDGKNETSTNYDVALYNSFDAGRYTRIQFDGNFVGPSVTTQGRTDSFWYANFAVRRQFMQRKINATISFRDVFNSARYVSKIITSDLQSVTRIKPNYPQISLSLSYIFNNYKSGGMQRTTGHDMFEGTNH